MRARQLIAPLLAVVTAAAAGCTHRPPAVGDATVGDPVAAAMSHYVALLRLRVASDSLAAMYTADGELLQPAMAPLRGPAAIRAFLAQFDGRGVVDTATVTVAPAAIYGAAAYQWGAYHQVARLDGGPAGTFDGRFAAEWHRAADGQWRLRRLLMQPGPSAAGAPAH